MQRHLKNDGIDAKVMTGITKAQGGNKTVDELKAERSINIQHSVERGTVVNDFYSRIDKQV